MPEAPDVPARVDNQTAAEAFVEWTCTPEAERDYDSKAELARVLDVTRDTLYRWRDSAWFQNMVRHRTLASLSEDRAEIYDALAEEAKGGEVRAIELYADLMGDHVQQVDVTSGGESLSQDDARTMTTQELTEALLEDKIQSAAVRQKIEESDMSKEDVAELLIELIEG